MDFLINFGPLILATPYFAVWVLTRKKRSETSYDGDPVPILWVFSLMPGIGWAAYLVLLSAIGTKICQRRAEAQQSTDNIFDEIQP